MHMRMRRKVASWIQVVNRAVLTSDRPRDEDGGGTVRAPCAPTPRRRGRAVDAAGCPPAALPRAGATRSRRPGLEPAARRCAARMAGRSRRAAAATGSRDIICVASSKVSGIGVPGRRRWAPWCGSTVWSYSLIYQHNSSATAPTRARRASA